jgi:hypothetical protein
VFYGTKQKPLPKIMENLLFFSIKDIYSFTKNKLVVKSEKAKNMENDGQSRGKASPTSEQQQQQQLQMPRRRKAIGEGEEECQKKETEGGGGEGGHQQQNVHAIIHWRGGGGGHCHHPLLLLAQFLAAIVLLGIAAILLIQLPFPPNRMLIGGRNSRIDPMPVPLRDLDPQMVDCSRTCK